MHEMAHSRQDRDMGDWPFSPKLTKANVWDTFVLVTLLDDHSSRHSRLSVPHTGEQAERFTAAMQNRNERIVHDGQPELTHACDKCTRIYEDGNGISSRVEVVVVDGLTMGHPCCAKDSCLNALPRNRNKKRFCEDHDYLHGICAIVSCSSPVTSGSMTCNDPKHREMERLHLERGKSIFRLRQMSVRARAKGISKDREDEEMEAMLDMDENEWFEVGDSGEVRIYQGTPESSTGQDDEELCGGKSDTGNKKVKAQFTRRRTHNEELIVRPCGVIVARATLNNAEGVGSVTVSSFPSLFSSVAHV